MIDIMLVLLMFFILSYKFAEEERILDVKIPSAEEGVPHVQQRGEIVVNFNAAGAIYVEGKEVTRKELSERLSAISRLYKNQPIRLRGDAQASYQTMVEIADVCLKAGIWNISFATQKPKDQ
ncbi:MAG: exbD1 [Akkermansiaceae bacterium]|nr:exbD1 [Akkermansiaceae bacterium]